MKPQEIIQKKRDGKILTNEEIQSFIKGVTDQVWADYQTSALIMAMFVCGLNFDEQNALTRAMLASGERMDFSGIEAPKADKHSTGGVGDKTSLIIAPLVAACGACVPMISGRGLGHTGGTLDKLESINGYNVNLSSAEFERVVKKCGFALAGQTENIVPADKKLYALRDATATVESIPLIVASIMSKKMAEDLDALVLDVKTGSGAFMKDFERAETLAAALCETGRAFGVRTEAVISDMNQPLGKFVGNSLEVFECVKILRNEADEQMSRTRELSVELSARMLVLSGISETLKTAKSKIEIALASGAALEKLRENVECQNGDAKICDAPEMLFGKSLLTVEIKAEEAGFINRIDTLAIGESVSRIGGGRVKVEDSIDYAVGYQCEKNLGDQVKSGETLGVIYCRNDAQAAMIKDKMREAYEIGDEKPLGNFELIKK